MRGVEAIRVAVLLFKVCLLLRLAANWPVDCSLHAHQPASQDEPQPQPPPTSTGEQPDNGSKSAEQADKRLFVVELLKMLHEQYGRKLAIEKSGVQKKEDRAVGAQSMLSQLLGALNADGDARRLIDWIRNSFNLASIGELTTQFVVSKLGSVNCAAILRPDPDESLVPRFLLFNEHFVDVPFELPLQPSRTECIAYGRFDPQRKTMVLIHGYLAGYTLLDGLTNIKNRLLDINQLVGERALAVFRAAAQNNGSYVLTEELEFKVRQQQYNVIVVDWFSGANPVPRSNYIKAAVNAQTVGRLIARFLLALVTQCRTPASSLQIIAHSLGCHVAGFTGKAMNAAGHQIGRITHLDPVGLCFGRLFSEPHFRLSPADAADTQAVHVSLNLFDNPLDGALSNFLVNGGRDQIGCGGQSELRNSTASSVSLLFDTEAKFNPCSHVRALALFEDDLSSRPDQCQVVGYQCATYERFLDGRCGRCDAQNGQCRLMSLPPVLAHFSRLSTEQPSSSSLSGQSNEPELVELVRHISNSSIAWLIDDQELNQKIGSTIAKLRPELTKQKPLQSEWSRSANEIKRSDRRLSSEHRERLAQTIDKIRMDTRNALAGWTSLATGGLSKPPLAANYEAGPSEPSEANLEPPPVPLGGQALPPGAINGPLYFVGTGPISPYCVNYYQFRLLIAEARLNRMLKSQALAPNRLAAQMGLAHGLHESRALLGGALRDMHRRQAQLTNRDTLHLTVKLSDSAGHFFKGFTLVQDSRKLVRVPIESERQRAVSGSSHMLELTMLLNTTKLEPVKIGESIVSYYFHGIVLADSIEVNYMSNISPEVRARYSSVLCPVAINDQHQLVRYVECNKLAAAS